MYENHQINIIIYLVYMGCMDMEVVCLDLEGVLVPEIWIAFAEATGIEELRLTTRDNPDYYVLLAGIN